MAVLEEFFHSFLMELVPIYLRSQLRGVRIDPWRQHELKIEFKEQLDSAAQRLQDFAGYPIIAKKGISNKVLCKLLYEDLGLPKQFHPKTKALTANAEALEKLERYVDDPKRPIFSDILTIRDLGVLINTFLDTKLDDDHRLRWSTNLSGTVSGRLSTSASPFWTGTNIQNWHESVRDIVVADPGHVFIYCDGEQAEARVVAFLSQDRNYLSLFERGISIHKQMASRIFPIRMEDVTKDSSEYKLAKAGVHACDYGMGIRRAAILFGTTESKAREILDSIHRELPGIRSVFHASIKEQLAKTRTLFTPFGRRRQFFDRWGDELFKAAFSYIPQSTVADWLNVGLLRLVRFSAGIFRSGVGALREYFSLDNPSFVNSPRDLECEIEPVANQHDGLLTQVRIEDLARAVPLVREAHTFEIPFPIGLLKIPVDVKIGFRWGNLISATPDAIKWVMDGEYDDRFYAMGALLQ